MTSPNMQEAREYCFQSDEDHNYYDVSKQECPSCKNISLMIKVAEARGRLAGLEEGAKIAEFHIKKEYLIKGKSDSWAQGNNTACGDIAEAIRKLK